MVSRLDYSNGGSADACCQIGALFTVKQKQCWLQTIEKKNFSMILIVSSVNFSCQVFFCCWLQQKETFFDFIFIFLGKFIYKKPIWT